MAKETFYPGTSYPMDPSYGESFSGYRVSAGKIGTATDPRTANQLNETSGKLNTGAQSIEVSAIQPKTFESIPDQHLKEINRLSKLTGSDTSVHAPMVEPSGFSQQGWSEEQREQAENQIWSAVKRSTQVDDKGNVPVTFHPAYQLPAGVKRMKRENGEEAVEAVAVNTMTGEPQKIRREPKAFPEKDGQDFNPKKEIEKMNDRNWNKIVNNLNYSAIRAEEVMERAMREPQMKKGSKISEGDMEEMMEYYEKYYTKGKMDKLPPDKRKEVKNVFKNFDHARLFLRDSYSQLRQLFNYAYDNADKEDRKKLDKYADYMKPKVESDIEKNPKKLQEFSEVIQEGVKTLSNLNKNPEILKPLNEFVTDKDSETFANTALKAYDEFGEKAPIINIENPPAGTGALDRAKDIKKVVEETRDKFVEKAKKKKGMSKNKAKKVAEKLIGATWDVGHINMLKKYGYDKADIAKETEKIAPYVKHVHLSDNFGNEHTELPMGKGNVPFKEIMNKLGKKGEDARKIIEAGDWYQHFKTNPLSETYEALGSGLYPMQSPYWNQVHNARGGYSSGFGEMLPQQHFTTYGGGFSGMPTELGGQMPGRGNNKRSRMGGAPMQ